MSFEELKALIESQIDDNDFDDDDQSNEDFKKNGIECVYEQAGHEGGGEDVKRVYRKDDIFVQITGTYSSYDGTTWDDVVTRVYPKETTITVYTADQQ